ncbi:pyruvate kinase alpha/beta domain-containing protein, partial [Priestia endophytica]
GQSVVHTSLNLNVNAILAPTESGYTAKMISKYRPQAQIIGVTTDEKVLRKLALVWGVHPVLGENVATIDEMLDMSVRAARKSNNIENGDVVVITAGVPVGKSGTTNLMKVQVVGELLAKGQGIGRKSAFGKVVVARNAKELQEKITEGSIVVTIGTDRDMMDSLEKASAIITEEGGLTSHGAVVGLSLGIPVIVGIENATEIFKDGQDVTVDGNGGVIYKGHASVL